MKKVIILIVVVLLLAMAAGAGCYFYNSADVFTGSRVKNPDCYLLEFEKMNQSDSHTLQLSAGDSLLVGYEVTGGVMDIDISAENGGSLYRGDGLRRGERAEFTIEITEDGSYVISVEGRHASGSLMVYAQVK